MFGTCSMIINEDIWSPNYSIINIKHTLGWTFIVVDVFCIHFAITASAVLYQRGYYYNTTVLIPY